MDRPLTPPPLSGHVFFAASLREGGIWFRLNMIIKEFDYILLEWLGLNICSFQDICLSSYKREVIIFSFLLEAPHFL